MRRAGEIDPKDPKTLANVQLVAIKLKDFIVSDPELNGADITIEEVMVGISVLLKAVQDKYNEEGEISH